MLSEVRKPRVAAIVKALDREIKKRPRGALSALERELGKSRGWWPGRVRAGRIGLHELFDVLDFLGMSPLGFFRDQADEDDEFELDRPCGPAPRIVIRAWERFESGEEGERVGEALLESLDRQRYDEPEETLQVAESAVRIVEIELLPRLLGIAGSTLRLLLRLDEADHAIQTGILIARCRGDRPAIADLVQRLAYVHGDRAEYTTALRLSQRAATSFLYLGATGSFGRALVDQGVLLSRLDRPQESIWVLRTALGSLSESDARNRCAALQLLGLGYKDLGDLDQALEFARQARAAAQGMEKVSVTKIVWLTAEIHRGLHRYEDAEAGLREVVDSVWPVSPADAALATCDLVRVLLLQGKREEAYVTARKMLALIEPLKANRIVSAAIADLLRSGRASLTLALVEGVYRRIAGERQGLRS